MGVYNVTTVTQFILIGLSDLPEVRYPLFVNQYYCDIPPVVALSCSSTYVSEMLVLVIGGICGFISFLTTLISYVYIISTILKIQSAEGKRKAFSTCASHLLVVCLFYGTAIFTYIRPSSSRHSPARDRLISMLYGVITPMLNPIIYSLRNTEVKRALARVVCGRTTSQ
ncbi:PREDICTED: olfactory receptor 5V1-like [Chinchilla lanigera]|uniref:olfactory receptor 5V1-like n=1 Tax=Chinchilla lanigera TaxID=34839 RepID=UPI0006972DCD|nr:PREDICTED: olfactory receptor 5V1-like [Chinchilla lanigera]